MKIILLDKVEPLGEKGEVKEVKKGYFRNFLFPRGLAQVATDEDLNEIEKEKKEKEKKEAKKAEDLQKKAEELKGKKIEIKARLIAGRRLFGSIKPKDIAKKLDLEEKQIDLKEPIKSAGEHKVKISLGKGVKTQVLVKVTSKKKARKKK